MHFDLFFNKNHDFVCCVRRRVACLLVAGASVRGEHRGGRAGAGLGDGAAAGGLHPLHPKGG